MLTPLLVIEKDSVTQTTILQNLRSVVALPQEIHVENNLDAALERVSNISYAAILVDIFLWDMEGKACFDCLIAKAPDIPIIVISDNSHIAKECVLSGAQDFVSSRDLFTPFLIKVIENAQLRQQGHHQLVTIKLLTDLRKAVQKNSDDITEVKKLLEAQEGRNQPLIH